MVNVTDEEYEFEKEERRQNIEEAIRFGKAEGISALDVFDSIRQQTIEVAAESVKEMLDNHLEPTQDREMAFPLVVTFAQQKVASVLADTKVSIEKIYGIELTQSAIDSASPGSTDQLVTFGALLKEHPECVIFDEHGEEVGVDEEKLEEIMLKHLSKISETNSSQKEERLNVLQKEILFLKHQGLGPVQCYKRLKKEAAETGSVMVKENLDLPILGNADKATFLREAWKLFLVELKEEIETIYDVKLKRKKRRK